MCLCMDKSTTYRHQDQKQTNVTLFHQCPENWGPFICKLFYWLFLLEKNESKRVNVRSLIRSLKKLLVQDQVNNFYFQLASTKNYQWPHLKAKVLKVLISFCWQWKNDLILISFYPLVNDKKMGEICWALSSVFYSVL
jgi:hypothetical protein